MAEERLCPRGEERADIRTALICFILAMIHRDPKKPKPKLEDFLLDFSGEGKKTKEQSSAQMQAIARALAATFGASQQQQQQRPARPGKNGKGK